MSNISKLNSWMNCKRLLQYVPKFYTKQIDSNILFLANDRKLEKYWVPIDISTWGNERVIYDTKMSCYDI